MFEAVMTDEEYNVLEDTMRVASMGAVLFAGAELRDTTVEVTNAEVSAFMTTLERNLRFVYEGVTKRQNKANAQACEAAAAAQKEHEVSVEEAIAVLRRKL